jgi:hypothetical protein
VIHRQSGQPGLPTENPERQSSRSGFFFAIASHDDSELVEELCNTVQASQCLGGMRLESAGDFIVIEFFSSKPISITQEIHL